jgi:hypothetical protein
MTDRTLLVRKKGFTRKAFTRRTRTGKLVRVPATRVAPATFRIKDIGAVGRGKKVIPPLKKGVFPKNFFSKPESSRRKFLTSMAKKKGEKVVVGRLRAVQVFNKRVNPALSKKALADSKFVAGSFKGRMQVQFPTGFRRAKLREIA